MTATTEQNDPALSGLSKSIRELYCQFYRHYMRGTADSYGRKPMPQWDGGQDSFGKRFQPVWPKIARFCLENSVEPGALLASVFGRARGARPPQPTHLASTTVLQQVRMLEQESIRIKKNEFNSTATAVRTLFLELRNAKRGSEVWCMQTAISGAQADIVLRYCLARIERLDALAAQYLPQAVEVYLFNRRIYDLAWEDIIPEELRTLSTQILQRITEGSRHV